MKLIVLSPFVYYPGVPHGGGALCWGQLEGLARHHEIHFLSFAQPDSTEYAAAQPHLNKLCCSVTTVPQALSRLRISICQFWLLSKLAPVGASLCKSDEMSAALWALIDRVKPDAVFVQFPQMAQYVGFCDDLGTVMDVQDAFSVSAYRRFKSQRHPLKKLVDFLTWLGWVRYESRWYPRFSMTTALTEQDRLGLEIFSPGLGVVTSPAAVRLPTLRWKKTRENTIAFIGSFSHPPNVEALLFFIHEIFPIVLRSSPRAVFLVAGKDVPAEVQKLACDNIRFLGLVPDAYEFVCSASVVVVPVKSGGGIKIKTLEALACGCPVVATSIGAEEIGAVSGTHLMVADTATDFARAVLAILQDSTIGEHLGANGRNLIEEKFSWDAKWASLNSLLERAVDRNAKAAESRCLEQQE